MSQKLTLKHIGLGLLSIIFISLHSVTLISCGSDDDSVKVKTNIKLSQTGAIMEKGKTLQLYAMVTPENIGYTWKSQNSIIASVDEKGLVTAQSLGSTRIIVTELEEGKTDYCNITVVTPKTDIKLSQNDAVIDKGKTLQLYATVTPENISCTWESEDPSIASVSKKGLVTAKSLGGTRIIATETEGGKTDYCNITVVTPKAESPNRIVAGGGVEINAAPFGLGYLEVLNSSEGRWHGSINTGWVCTATYTWEKTGETTARMYSVAYQSLTGRTWTIDCNFTFSTSNSGTVSYRAVAPTESKSGTCNFKVYGSNIPDDN